MAKTHEAAFAQDPRTRTVTLMSSSTADGATATLLYTAGTEGALINGLFAAPRGTVTANGVVFFKEKAGSTDRGAFASLTVGAWDSAVPANLTKALPIAKVDGISVSAPDYLERGDKIYACLLSTAANGVSVGVTVQEFKDLGGV